MKPSALASWFRRHGWTCLIVLLVCVAIALAQRNTRNLRKEIRKADAEVVALRTEVATLGAEVAVLKQEVGRQRDELAARLPVTDTGSFVETPSGLKAAPAKLGLTREELDFLVPFRGPLLKADALKDALATGVLQPRLQAALTADCRKRLPLLQSRYGLTSRQALIACAVLRTNGSIPTYEVRGTLPNDLRQLVAGTSGNCSDHAVRLMMMLESIGVQATLISSVTKNLAGHVFVDAYDPQEQTSYLLDANFNVMIVGHALADHGFLEPLLSGQVNRATFSQKARIHAFPVYFRFVDPGETGLTGTPLTPDFINSLRADREPMWRRWLAGDLDELRGWWQRTPGHRPKSLAEVRRTGISSIPESFTLSERPFRRLRKAAGLNDA